MKETFRSTELWGNDCKEFPRVRLGTIVTNRTVGSDWVKSLFKGLYEGTLVLWTRPLGRVRVSEDKLCLYERTVQKERERIKNKKEKEKARDQQTILSTDLLLELSQSIPLGSFGYLCVEEKRSSWMSWAHIKESCRPATTLRVPVNCKAVIWTAARITRIVLLLECDLFQTIELKLPIVAIYFQ